jgi:radical SAM superfamily enzyme YgiQ (UPF0313 family)
MTQINTPYPASAYLTGFLRSRGFDVTQRDPSIELFSRLYSHQGLSDIAKEIKSPTKNKKLHASVSFFQENLPTYLLVINATMDFMRGKDPSLAHRIVNGGFLPEGPRFDVLDEYESVGGDESDEQNPLMVAFGNLGIADRAKYMASLFLNDIGDVIREGVDPRFETSRYGEKLSTRLPTFQPLHAALSGKATLIDHLLTEITKDYLEEVNPTLVGMSLPFPGNVYGGFRMASVIKSKRPDIKIVLGGGFVNTELRSLSDPAVFDYVDYITLDDGERPFLSLLDHLAGGRDSSGLKRTFIRQDSRVVFKDSPLDHDIPHKDAGTPTYQGLPLDKYISILEMLNPMHRIWSDGRWNKATLAHGCYWNQCKFCDISLDYISRYDPASADLIIDRMESLVAETGQRGFHFVDEAAPPQVLFALSKRLLERKLPMTWWGNIRFEKSFNLKTAPLLASAGCIAVSGGLEVASDRLLKLMNKGVTVEQVARVTHALTESGILVHAYLMYGFPTQTMQETIDSLERVRQLFLEGCIQSGFWHRFSATIHSPIGKEPEKFGIRLRSPAKVSFAINDVDFEDPTGCDHDMLGIGLRKALYNFMHGVGLEEDVRFWFPTKVPKAQVSPKLVSRALAARDE